MFEPHEGFTTLRRGFSFVLKWLRSKGETELITAAGSRFSARAHLTGRGAHAGEWVIRIFQNGVEFGRVYRCCWGHYYNCNRTRIGMYCVALDFAVK